MESALSAPGLAIEFRAVPPGLYQAVLSYTPTEDEHVLGRQEETSALQTITVEAARRTEISLALD